MIQYPGGTIVNATFTGATRQDIVTGIYDNLLLAGWTYVSGAADDRLMQSALTPQNLQCRVRLYDLGGANNCARVQFRSVDGLRLGVDNFLLPAPAKTFRIIANKYQFFVLVPGLVAGRSFCAGGVVFLEGFLVGTIYEAIWSMRDFDGDGAGGPYGTFRNTLRQDAFWGGSWQCCNGNAWATQNPGGGFLRLLTANQSLKWHDGSGFKIPARIFWGLTWRTDESKCRGQLWGAVVSTNQNAMDLVTTFDGHDWYNITNDYARGSLWVQIT